MRSLIQRIEKLETQIKTSVHEPYLRQVLSDKLEPIQDDIKEIKSTLSKVFDLIIHKDNK